MKDFRVCNNDFKNWIESKCESAKEVVMLIERENMNTFEIEWETPVTGEYKRVLEVVNGETVYVSDVFNIPVEFEKYINN